MEKQNISTFNTTQDINVEQTHMMKIVRKERDDIIKQAIKNYASMDIIQGTNKTQDNELQNTSEWQSELDLQNRRLKELVGKEIQMNLNSKNYMKNTKPIKEMVLEQSTDLDNTLQVIEINTEKIGVSKSSVFKHISKYLSEHKLKQKWYEEEIKNIQRLVDTEIKNDNKVIEESKLTFYSNNKKLSELTKTEQNLSIVIKESQSLNSQYRTELRKKKVDRDNWNNELRKLQDSFLEINNKHNINTISYETQLETLETHTAIYKECIENMLNKIGSLEQEHTKIDEEISQVQSDLNKLEISHGKKEENFTTILSKSVEIKGKACRENEEKKFEIKSLEDKMKISRETNIQLKKINKKFQMKLQDKKSIIKNFKKILFAENQQQEEVIKQIKDIQKEIKENLSDYKETIKEYKNNISEVQFRNKQKKEINEVQRNEVEDKENIIINIKHNIKNTTNKNNGIIQENISTTKNLQTELIVLQKNLELLNFEINKVIKSIEKEIKSLKKMKRTK